MPRPHGNPPMACRAGSIGTEVPPEAGIQGPRDPPWAATVPWRNTTDVDVVDPPHPRPIAPGPEGPDPRRPRIGPPGGTPTFPREGDRPGRRGELERERARGSETPAITVDEVLSKDRQYSARTVRGFHQEMMNRQRDGQDAQSGRARMRDEPTTRYRHREEAVQFRQGPTRETTRGRPEMRDSQGNLRRSASAGK